MQEQRYRIKDACSRWHYGGGRYGYDKTKAMNYSSIHAARLDGDQFPIQYFIYTETSHGWIVPDSDKVARDTIVMEEGGVYLEKLEVISLALDLTGMHTRDSYSSKAKHKIVNAASQVMRADLDQS